MNLLPKVDLEIEEDLEKLMSESEDEDEINVPVEDLTQRVGVAQPKDIFLGKPTNKEKVEFNLPEKREMKTIKKPVMVDELGKPIKKKLSEKQRLHLERIRIKALESKKEKQRLKKEIKERVEVEVKETRAKRKPKPKTQREQYTEDFKERMHIVEPPIENIPQKEEMAFLNFMSNMEKFQSMRQAHAPPVQPRPPAPVPSAPPLPTPTPKPLPTFLSNAIQKGEGDPYACNFVW